MPTLLKSIYVYIHVYMLCEHMYVCVYMHPHILYKCKKYIQFFKYSNLKTHAGVWFFFPLSFVQENCLLVPLLLSETDKGCTILQSKHLTKKLLWRQSLTWSVFGFLAALFVYNNTLKIVSAICVRSSSLNENEILKCHPDVQMHTRINILCKLSQGTFFPS